MGEGEKDKGIKFNNESLTKGIMRANGRGWTPDRYAKMGLLVFMYNKIKARPNDYGLENNCVSSQIHAYIKDHAPELIKRFEMDKIPNMELDKPEVVQDFVNDIEHLNSHAIEFNSNMPTFHEMIMILEEVSEHRRRHFESMRKSVEWRGGEFTKEGKGKESSQGYLIEELREKEHQIREQKRQIRRTRGWALLKGVGVAASIGLGVLSLATMFAPGALGLGAAFAGSLFTRVAAGLVGGIASFAGLRGFGASFFGSIAKIFGQRRKLRDLRYNEGKGKGRGLSSIRKQIKLHEEIRNLFNDYDKMFVNGKPPTEQQFYNYIKHHFKRVWRGRNSYGNEGVNLKKLWSDVKATYSAEKGKMRSVMDFLAQKEVSVVQNNEIPIERLDRYDNDYFGVNGDFRNEQNQPIQPSLANVHQGIRNLAADQNRFTDGGMLPKYKATQANASKALVTAYDSALFEEPYSNSANETNQRLAEDKDIQDRLKEYPGGDKTKLVNNALTFINAEGTRGDEIRLDQSLGVPVVSQLSRESKDIVKGCKVLDSGVNDAEANDIASEIELMTSKAAATQILNKINSSSLDSKVKSYLTKMVEYRTKESKVSTEQLKTAFGGEPVAGSHEEQIYNAIMSLSYDEATGTMVSSDGKTIEDIRAMIYERCYVTTATGEKISKQTYLGIIEYDSGARNNYVEGSFLSEDQQTAVESLLKEQMNSIELRRKNEIRANVVNIVRSGGVNFDLKELLDKFDSMTYDTLSEQETWTLYATKITKATPTALKDYLVMRFQQRVERIFEIKVQKPNEYIGEGGLERLSKDLKMVADVPFLTQAQKDKIIDKLESRLPEAFNVSLRNMELKLLEDFENNNGDKKYSDILYRYLERPYAEGGFKDLLKRNSEVCRRIRERIEKLRMGVKLETDLVVAAPGVSKIVDSKSDETTAILRVLFKADNGTSRTGVSSIDFSYQLKDIATIIRNNRDQGLKSDGFATGIDGKVKILEDFKRKMQEIMSSPRPADEKLAMMLLVKKNILGMVKAHLNMFINTNRADAMNYVRTSGAASLRKITDGWSPVCSMVDANIDKLMNDPMYVNDTAYVSTGLNFGNASATLSAAASAEKILSFTSSPYSEIGENERA